MRVIITGASKGIGRGIANVLAEAGFALGLLARSADSLQQLKSDIQQHAPAPAIAPADLRSHDQTHAAINLLIDQLGGIDALINNAGLVIRRSALDLSLEQWHAMIETNINGLFYATRAVLPHLQRQKRGHIVNISSISGYLPLPGGSAYAATKYAVTGFSESLLGEVRDLGIKVTTVFPGSVDTDSHRQDPAADHDWKLTPRQIGQSILHLLRTDPNHCISRLEVRPLQRPPA